MKKMIIAIDGHSSCGKSTLAKALAQHFGYLYVDSGAMYRAVTLHFIRGNIDLKNEALIQSALTAADIRYYYNGSRIKIFLGEEDVSDEIRKMYVAEKVSLVSSIKTIRQALVEQQRALGLQQSLIMDGRDIGTNVFPNAPIKFFIKANTLIRAQRRHKELIEKGDFVAFDDVYQNIKQRDYLDSTRQENPLVCPNDAIVLDNSEITKEQQLSIAIDHINLVLTNSTTP